MPHIVLHCLETYLTDWRLLYRLVCDEHCTSDCTTRGAAKCDSTCAAGYSLQSDYTCARTSGL